MVVAEIGNNHEGDFSIAAELIGRAAEAGADAVKFQSIVPERLVQSEDADRLERLRKFQLSPDEFNKLALLASEAGLIFFSTAFDIETANRLDQIQPVHKVSSGDNNFLALIDALAGFSKPLIVSTGLASFDLLQLVQTRIFSIWEGHGVFPGLCLQHCVSSYPVPKGQENLKAITSLRDLFPNATVGYSDHTLGIQTPILAAAAGARVIEKHFTINKQHSDFRDHALSADPSDLARMVSGIREVEEALGDGRIAPRECEQPLLTGARRSIAAARDLPAGTILTAPDLTWLRPGTGLPPGKEEILLGKKTLRALSAGEIISPYDVSA